MIAVAPSLSGAALLGAVLGMFAIVALLVAPRSKRPASALAWIMVITFVPVLGLLLYLLLGSPQLPKHRRDKQQQIDQLFTDRSRVLTGTTDHLDAPAWLPPLARLNQALGAMPLLEGNSATLLTGFDHQMAKLVEAVSNARHYVHVEFYILSYDQRTAPFFTALAEAIRRGVTVRVLLDHLGSRSYPGYNRARTELDRMGASWRLMLPIQPLHGRYQRPDLRNHRKLLVVDGEVGFVGSLNLIEPGYQKGGHARGRLQWHDLLAEVRGPIVREVDAVFATDWYSETEELLTSKHAPVTYSPARGRLLAQICPSGPAFSTENNLALFNTLLYQAEHRVSITSPYFVPDESLLAAITTAARRGVQVELFVSEIGDQFFVYHAQHSYYTDLLAAGVRIYLYPAPFILHAKHLSIDEDVAVIGSSNMDIRSFQLDLELMLTISGRTFVEELRTVEDGYRLISRELTGQEWNRRTRSHRMLDDLTRLTSSLQ
ncbi:cardiolipin synthase [Kocuria arenosa]|uniref:cardiolipin synthase n=1 Tax=Kocuria arenosa TaxID=3071446 RepID=UPI0034D5B203